MLAHDPGKVMEWQTRVACGVSPAACRLRQVATWLRGYASRSGWQSPPPPFLFSSLDSLLDSLIDVNFAATSLPSYQATLLARRLTSAIAIAIASVKSG